MYPNLSRSDSASSGMSPRRGSLNFHPGVTLLLSHSNSSSKFQAEAGIVTALGRARCCYRLGDDQYCTRAHVCIAGVNTYIHTLMGVAYNMQPIVWGGSIGGVIYISIHTQTTSECGNICLDGFEVQTSIINHEAVASFLPYYCSLPSTLFCAAWL